MNRSLPHSIHARYGRQRDRYLELIHQFPLRPIRNDSELDAAIAIINELIDMDKLAAAEDDYLDVLSDLVEDYEDVAIPIRDVSDAEMLRFLLSQREETQTQLARKTDIPASTISEVLTGKRKLNRLQIGKLARHFKVEPGVFAFSEIH